METKPRILQHFLTRENRDPFQEWLGGLRDLRGQAKILTRLRRVKEGNFGKCDPVGDGVRELKIDFGPGYRVYFGLDGEQVIILGGGVKDTQSSDIRTAIERWREYNA